MVMNLQIPKRLEIDLIVELQSASEDCQLNKNLLGLKTVFYTGVNEVLKFLFRMAASMKINVI